MKTSVEPLEGNKVKLSVEVEELEFDKAVDAALRKIAREVRIPGFRPGKAPRKLLEARMGKEGVRQEAMREALPDYYAEALRQTEVDAIAPPEIDVTSGQDDGPLAFDAVVEVRPQVNLVGYQGLQVTVPSPDVTDEELQKQIDRLRTPVRRAQGGRPADRRTATTSPSTSRACATATPSPASAPRTTSTRSAPRRSCPAPTTSCGAPTKGATVEFESPFGEVDGEEQTRHHQPRRSRTSRRWSSPRSPTSGPARRRSSRPSPSSRPTSASAWAWSRRCRPTWPCATRP